MKARALRRLMVLAIGDSRLAPRIAHVAALDGIRAAMPVTKARHGMESIRHGAARTLIRGAAEATFHVTR